MNTNVSEKTSIRGEQKEDLTGRARLISNVAFSWAGYLIVIITGFIMPRVIDHHVGQTLLGIWDFSWSIVNYLTVQSLGVGSSINRYVAKYRAVGNTDGLRTAVSSVIVVQLIIALWVALLTLVVVQVLPFFFQERLGTHMSVARWVIAFLGGSVVLQMAFDASRGVMTGCHRWDLYNVINSISRAITVIAMIAALYAGGGLKAMSVIYFAVILLTEVTRTVVALRLCPELEIRWRFVSASQAKKMLLFGCKTIIAGIPPFILIQTINIFVVGFSGPAMLAIFSRCTALVRHIETIVNKFAYILTPTAGSLQGTGQIEDLRTFLRETTKYAVAITLPMVLFLIIDGDLVLRIWMGADYAEGTVLTILAIGYLLPISQSSAIRILMGMNLHGKIGIISLATNIGLFCAGVFVVSFLGWDLSKSALLVAVPLTIGSGIIVPLYACRKLGIPVLKYVHNSFSIPLLCNIPFVVSLYAIRTFLTGSNWIIIGVSLSACGIILLPLYMFFVLEKEVRHKITRRITAKTEAY